jgi:hypothetical protein
VAPEQLIAEHTGDLGSISEPCGPEESTLSADVVGSTLAGEPQQANASRNLDPSRQEIDCNVSCAGGGRPEGSLGSEDPRRGGQGSTLRSDLPVQMTSYDSEERLQQLEVPPTSHGRDRDIFDLFEYAEQIDDTGKQSGLDLEGDRDSINLGDEESNLELGDETEEELGFLEDMFGGDALYADLFSYD